jgi:GNAT superfamily N-acetyltransferase
MAAQMPKTWGDAKGVLGPKWSFSRVLGRESLGTEQTMQEPTVHRASLEEIEQAFDLVTEYYQEMGVEVREDMDQFEQQYFVGGAGVWLAVTQGEIVGCVALRKLAMQPGCGEIKRMYVRAPYRGRGIADSLLKALEEYAAEWGYEWLYLDTMNSMVAAARFYERNSYRRCERYNDNPQAGLFLRKRVTGKPTGCVEGRD